MKRKNISIGMIIILLIAWVAAGCNNPDEGRDFKLFDGTVYSYEGCTYLSQYQSGLVHSATCPNHEDDGFVRIRGSKGSGYVDLTKNKDFGFVFSDSSSIIIPEKSHIVYSDDIGDEALLEVTGSGIKLMLPANL